ncbi:riboflavin synthase [Deinococcus radiophilus]|uniref:Riboflavin synthase n=1 Tax=Deinococcus radiophilus TaxID=32062 RepID=A0A3S0KEW3_9DEIO|nr:riboflavin synthase [Deinococcus radiophilus]RTR28987.1 riboflavin synthase [Deinococcus radiophilus]UFA49570.1 riboflavin synthase [Deinococcus radiophilus]
MFTGIITQVGRVAHSKQNKGGLSLRIEPAELWPDLELGESIACNGTCLTVTDWDDQTFGVDLSQETLAKTAPHWQAGDALNLERAMTAGDRFGGHIVSGHVDGVGEIVAISPVEGAYVMVVRAPALLAPYLMPKGSITVDGVSLTIVDSGGPAGSKPELAENEFTLWLVPHTLEVTTLGGWQPGRQVNLEADQMAKYLDRLLAFREGRRQATEG